jgi:hypothetical protein
MTTSSPVVSDDDTELPAPDAELATTPDAKAPGHPMVFLEDGPTLEEPVTP